MVSLLYAISFVSLLLSSVAAHGNIVDVTINGKKFTAGSVMRGNQNQNPNSRSSGNNLICNTGGKTSTTSFATANPGDSMTFNWRTWTKDRHPGYIETFLARCGDTAQACNGFNPTGKVWFKIQETGLLEPSKSFNGGNWATDQLKRDGNKFTMTLPRGLKKGGYIMRQNIVAMHLVGKPEFYPNCIHLSVGGSGTGVPSSSQLVSIPGYLNTPEAQKALNFNIFAKYNSYTIAGPRPVTSFSSSGGKAAAAPPKETPAATGSGTKDTKGANPKPASTKPAVDIVECTDDDAKREAPKVAKPFKRSNESDEGTIESKRDASDATFVSGVQPARQALGSKHGKRRLAEQH